MSLGGGRRGTRTPSLRFWRPLLYQLSYSPSTVRSYVMEKWLKNLGDVTGTNCFTTLTDRKSLSRFHGNGFLKFNIHSKVITRHHHFNSFRKLNITSNISCSKEELRAISLEEWGMTTSFFFVKQT